MMLRRQFYTLLLVSTCLLPLLFLCGGLYCCAQRHGFTIDKISSTIEYNPHWNTPPLSREQTDFLVHEVFSQPYYYLASGSLCYAFLSQDQRFVLKFFKMRHLGQKPRPLQKAHSPRALSFERVFASYTEAYQELPEETGLLYVHFNKTQDLKTKLALIDAQGKKQRIDLDEMEFVVQRKAERFWDHLLVLDEEHIHQALRAFFRLIAERSRKGFSAHGLSIRNNFGFCGTHAMQIDCSTLVRDDAMKYPSNFREEVMLVAERINQSAQIHNPDLCIIIQEEAQRVINEFFHYTVD